MRAFRTAFRRMPMPEEPVDAAAFSLCSLSAVFSAVAGSAEFGWFARYRRSM
jgi:hypothetical protein